jgi:hypothetical protein
VRYQDADEMAADLHTCLAELRGRVKEESAPSGTKTVKLEVGVEPTVVGPATSAIATDTRLPVSRHFDSAAALKRLGRKSALGRAPRPAGLLKRIALDAAPRRLALITLCAAVAGGYIAFV